MAGIVKITTDGIPNGPLAYKELGYDKVDGELYVGTGAGTGDGIKLSRDSGEFKVTNKAETEAHMADVANPHAVTKLHVGLGNVDDTADADKPLSTAETAALLLKQAIVAEGAFVDGDKTKLDGIEALATIDQTGAEIKVAYEAELDTNAYTDAEKVVVDVATPLDTTAVTLPTAINEVVGRATANEADVTKNTAVAGTDTLLRYDKQLANRDITATEYDGESNLTVVRYTGDDNSAMYYRDVLEYDVDLDLSNVKHYYGTINLTTESASTSLGYDVNKNLISSTYVEI